MSLLEELGIRSSSQRIEMALRAVQRGWLMGKQTIASFLRHLIRRENYVPSVKFWRQGKLGSVCQAALTSALGFGGRVAHNLGFQESKFMPFLFCSAEQGTGVSWKPERPGTKRNYSRERSQIWPFHSFDPFWIKSM